MMVVEKGRQQNRDGAVKEDRQDNRGSVVKSEGKATIKLWWRWWKREDNIPITVVGW